MQDEESSMASLEAAQGERERGWLRAVQPADFKALAA